MTNKIGIIGGDLRIIRLAEILSKDKYLIYTYGFDKYDFLNENILKCGNIQEVCNNCEKIISGVPFSKDGKYLEAPFSNEKISINNLLNTIQNKTLIAGKINNIEEINNYNLKIIDLLEIEELTILNVIPTVEGAIKIAIEETEFTLNEANCLILGFGRIGKLLAKELQIFGTKVYLEARKQSDLAWIKALGYIPVDLKDLNNVLNNSFDIIFNTIPAIILDEDKINILKETKPLIIELASKPGGVDLNIANNYGIRVINAQGLPGKVAPLTSAKNIKRVIDGLL